MYEIPEAIPYQESEKDKDYCYKIFQETSGAEESSVLEIKNLFADLPKLPTDAFEAAREIKRHLMNKKFVYDDKFFCLQDILKNKSGNCLGLTMLIGAVLYEKGFRPEYHIISHPKDIISKKEEEFFERANRGEYFTYDNPILANEQSDTPRYRFNPAVHPQIILDGKPFETTDLDEDIDQDWTLDAEFAKEVSYEQMASYVYLDRARRKLDISNSEGGDKELIKLCSKAIEAWEENREAYCMLKVLGDDAKIKELSENALKKYMQIGGKDALFFYGAYLMTKKEEYLDKALEIFPSFILPFTTKKVYHEKNIKEAKFNLAVAALCIANSAPLTLKDFYLTHKKKIIQLYGQEEYDNLAVEIGIKN